LSNEKEKWATLRVEINNSYELTSKWKDAIDLFHSRVDKKFFRPIETILSSKKFEGEGFTILTAQCSLIESLAAFREGKIYNNKLKKTSPTYEYSSSGHLYISFLLTANIFNNVFFSVDANGKKMPNSPYSAEEFYSEVRCGLLHEARTKGNWTVNVKKGSKKETRFIEQTKTAKKIYRTILHYRLKHYVESYCIDLKQEGNKKERRLFARKLDDLFDFPRDSAQFDWWKDP
jgi:hypothetical protein